MQRAEFERLRTWVGFTEEDAQHLRRIAAFIEPHLPKIAKSFYEKILQDPQANAVLSGGPMQLQRLHRAMVRWLTEAFGGEYDKAFFERRSRVGHVHVDVNLPEHFMVLGMGFLRHELTQAIESSQSKDRPQTLAALNRLLDLELALMLQTYHERYVEKIRKMDSQNIQHQLDEVQHMAQIGQLAAALAHEIKNPLAGISGAIQVISTGMDKSNPHWEIMREILRQIDRLDSVVKDLLVYARPKPPERQIRDIRRTIQHCLRVLSGDPQLRTVRLRCEGFDKPAYARIDAGQFEQVFSNLILNAVQACETCEERGEVTLRLFCENGRVLVHVRDNGKGMTPEVLQRATEPFFTTKSRGTGLGLSICKRIIDAHEGELHIQTAPEQGTLVVVSLSHAAPVTDSEGLG